MAVTNIKKRLWFFLLMVSLPAVAADPATVGIVYPLDDVSLSFPVDGRLMSIRVKEGVRVEKGQPLMLLDDHLQKLEVQRRKLIWQDNSQLELMRKNLELLEEMVESKKKLYADSKTVSKLELKHNQMQLNKLRGEYEMLLVAKQKEKLEYEISREVLSSYSINSPISGVVVEVTPSVGEWARTGEPVIRVIDSSKCFLELNVEMSALPKMTDKASHISVRMPARDRILIRTGRVEYISSIVDEGSGLVRVKVFMDNADSLIIPGVTAQILVDPAAEQITKFK
jgi:RND family efflux transporter MFP subunit